MDNMKTACVNVAVNSKEDSAPVDPATAFGATAPGAPEPTFTITEAQLRELMASIAARDLSSEAAAPAASGVTMSTGPRQATMPEACVAYKLLTRLEQATSRMIVGTRDRVAVPGNLYVVDKASPLVLALLAASCLVAASGAEKVSAYFTRLAANTASKSSDRSLR
jgi:hypothetical protein